MFVENLPPWAREVITSQTDTITLLSQTLKRTAEIMTAQSDASLAAVQALAAAAHTAAETIAQLKTDKATDAQTIANLQAELATAQASAEDPAAMQAITDAANAATAELAAQG